MIYFGLGFNFQSYIPPHMKLTASHLLKAYASGIFPMANSAESKELLWFDPPMRALIPLDDRFHIPRRLQRVLRKEPFLVTLNKAFSEVINGCAAPALGREITWINAEIVRLYEELHRKGHAHSIEAWEGDNLIGGLYGVSLGGAFFGESMFSRKTDASKIALVHLVELLKRRGYVLLDAQFQTPHLKRFGAYEIEREKYLALLGEVIKKEISPFFH